MCHKFFGNIFKHSRYRNVCNWLVDAYEDYSCFGEVSFLGRVEVFKMEQRAAIKFCAKLKKTATENIDMPKRMFIENRLRSSSESEHNVDCIRDESVPERQAANGRVHKEVTKRLIARLQCVGPEFQESSA
jgi:hypothetical protein